MKKSFVCRIVRIAVLAIAIGILRYKYDIGIGGSPACCAFVLTWGLCEFIDTGLK